MTVEVALWVLGLILVPMVTWAIAIMVIMRDVKRATEELLSMHKNPDGYGFGTINLSEMVEEQRRLTSAVVHYLRWAAEKLTGEIPPPPLEGRGKGRRL